MEERMQIIQAAGNSKIQIGVIPGHYATNHSHINYYVDITSLKTGYKMAKEAAKALAATYVSTHIDTIICLEGTLYQYLGTGIYRRCSFVQNEHWRQGEHYSCDTEKLFLSCGDSAVAV